jgi:hypothetical protein
MSALQPNGYPPSANLGAPVARVKSQRVKLTTHLNVVQKLTALGPVPSNLQKDRELERFLKYIWKSKLEKKG